MSGKRYSEEFKIEAVKQVTERGYKVTDVCRRLGITSASLHKWIKLYGDAGSQHQQISEQQDELRKIRAELRCVDRFAARLKGPAVNQHGGVFVDLGQVFSQLEKPSLFFSVVVVDASHGVVVIDFIGIEIATPATALATGDGLLPHFANETGLGDVLLALMTVDEEDEVVMEALFGCHSSFQAYPNRWLNREWVLNAWHSCSR